MLLLCNPVLKSSDTAVTAHKIKSSIAIMELKQNNSANISDLIEHSHSMLRHAEAGEWDTVVNDEVIRRQLINTFFSEPSNIANEPEISSAIQQLLLINDKLEKLSIDARDEAKTEVNSITSGRKAVNAYADNAR